MHAPDVQGSRNELKMFSIQAVSDIVHIRSEAFRPIHRLTKERKHTYIYVSACWGEQSFSMSVYACVTKGRYMCSGVCELECLNTFVKVYVSINWSCSLSISFASRRGEHFEGVTLVDMTQQIIGSHFHFIPRTSYSF